MGCPLSTLESSGRTISFSSAYPIVRAFPGGMVAFWERFPSAITVTKRLYLTACLLIHVPCYGIGVTDGTMKSLTEVGLFPYFPSFFEVIFAGTGSCI